jgi:hypothetical protein
MHQLLIENMHSTLLSFSKDRWVRLITVSIKMRSFRLRNFKLGLFLSMKVILACFVAIFLTACVGGGPVVTKTSISKVPAQPRQFEPFCPSNTIAVMSGCESKQVGAPTSEDFRRAWGEPKSIEQITSQTRWTYNIDVAWRGLVVFAVIPIPLMLPVGHNELFLSFENDRLVEIKREYGEGNYAICGLHSEGPNGFGCITGWR